MIRFAVTALTLAGLTACSPAPRSASYFEAHPDDAAQVVADCQSGAHRGEECVNARAAAATAARAARMNAYKKNF